MIKYNKVPALTFEKRLSQIKNKNNLAHTRNYSNKICFLSVDENSGFCLTKDGLLCHVFSLKQGQGKYAIKTAIKLGANRLSCYDGFLPNYYRKFGFKILVKEENKIFMGLTKLKGPCYY